MCKKQTMKSPLNPSIHFRCFTELKKLLVPKSKICSFFLYDANIELNLCRYEHFVTSITNIGCIYEFWNLVKKDPKHLSNVVKVYLDLLDEFNVETIRQEWFSQNSAEYRSAYFYIFQKISNLGYASSGKLSLSNLSNLDIIALKNFKSDNFSPLFSTSDDPIKFYDELSEMDYFLLPVGNYSLNLFEQGKNKGPEMYTFNHKEIHARAKGLDKKCILLYKNHPALFNLYKSFNIKMVDKYGKASDNKESCEDLIITNF